MNGKWPKFVVDARNIRLGLALDGSNPFRELEFLSFYMVNSFVKLESTSMVGD